MADGAGDALTPHRARTDDRNRDRTDNRQYDRTLVSVSV